ncbi:MAG: hypothetical protein KDD29_03095, partial [Flavobacteriales bacterium]|nr:hypothetical protein [Flavobacteriales bacterium]
MSSLINVFGQKAHDNINLKKINTSFLVQLIEEKINEERAQKDQYALKQDPILKLAAADQSDYILKGGRVVHDQNNKKKATPFDRVVFYEGLINEVGENCMQTALGAKVKV